MSHSEAAPGRPGEPAYRWLRLPSATLRIGEVGDGPPLLMINGIGANMGMWRPLAATLARHRALVMFDAPGAGWSPALDRATRMPGLAQIVVELIDALGYDRMDVLGYSWGGVLAQQLAHDRPGRVRHLVLASTTPGRGGRTPSPLVVAAVVSPLRYVSARYLAAIAPHVYGGDARRTGGGLPMTSWRERAPSARGYAQQLFAIAGWSSLPWLADVTHPTLVIQGGDDPLVPAHNGRLISATMPNAELHVEPRAGHLWLLEHPAEAAAVIETFLT